MFKYGKTYIHEGTGDILRIVGCADTYSYGKCLIGEDQHGELFPVGQEEDNFQNWKECDIE